METGLIGKVVVITGGTACIGKAAAIEFAKEGCRVAVCGHTDERLAAFQEKTRKLGYDIYCAKCEIGNPEQEQALVEEIIERFGRIDVWINNAGINRTGELTEVPDDVWAKIMDVNLNAAWRFIKYVTPHFKKAGGGQFINNTAFSGLIPQIESGAYGVSKSGMIALTRVAAAELAPFHIRVNGVAPGVIMTPLMQMHLKTPEDLHSRLSQVPMNRPADPAEVGKVMVFLASDAASYITGEIIQITGGKYAVQDRMPAWTKHKPDEIQ